jgi:hypothetical protein
VLGGRARGGGRGAGFGWQRSWCGTQKHDVAEGWEGLGGEEVSKDDGRRTLLENKYHNIVVYFIIRHPFFQRVAGCNRKVSCR